MTIYTLNTSLIIVTTIPNVLQIGLNQLPESTKQMIISYIKVLGNEVSFMKVSKDEFMQWVHQGYIPNIGKLPRMQIILDVILTHHLKTVSLCH